jgi:hypothetical protein
MQPSPMGRTDVAFLPLLLVSVGALAARFAITEPGTAWFWPVGVIAGYALAANLLALSNRPAGWLIRSHGTERRPSQVAIALGIVLLAAPFLEGAGRAWAGQHLRPLEQVTIHAVMNFAFLAVSFPGLQRSQAGAVGVSAVLLLAAVVLGEHAAIAPLAAVYAGLGAAWFAHAHWRAIRRASASGDAAPFPFVPVLGIVVLLGGLTAAAGRFAGGTGSTWGEWAPSSGGSRWSNPDALLGVGDGDWVASGPNARSTGSIDSAYFLESELPTIYDALMESYGEPRSPRNSYAPSSSIRIR